MLVIAPAFLGGLVHDILTGWSTFWDSLHINWHFH
jgi:hypothetical protein